MRRIALSSMLMLLAGLLLMPLASPPAAATAADATQAVTVTYEHPAKFTETTKARPYLGASAMDYLQPLKQYVVRRAQRILKPGQHLQITITDIDRAGNFEPWLGPDYQRIRIIRDIYPPRIDLSFRLLGADGKLLREGRRTLRNPAFLMGQIGPPDDGSLRFEKQLIDRWLSRGPDRL